MSQLNLHKKLPLNSKVAVLGAGLSGLTFSYFLNRLRPDLKLTIFEQSSRPSGWINTDYVKFSNIKEPVKLEKGPRTLRGISDGSCMIVDIMSQLGHKQDIMCIAAESSANRKFLLDKSHTLLQIPPTSVTSFLKFLTNPLSSGFFRGMLVEAFKPKRPANVTDESVSGFLGRRFGTNEISDNIFSAIFHGIYAGDVKKLSANYVLRRLVELEKEYGSLTNAAFKKSSKKQDKDNSEANTSEVLKLYGQGRNMWELQKVLKKYPMLGFQNGLSTLTDALAKHLSQQENLEIKYNSPISSIKTNPKTQHAVVVGDSTYRFDHVHASTVPKSLKISDELTSFLNSITSVNVALVNVYHPTKDLIGKSHHGFGYLVPQSVNNPQKLLGVIFDSVIENKFQPVFDSQEVTEKDLTYTKVTAMLGGHFYNNGLIPTERVIIHQVKECLAEHMQMKEEDIEECEFEFTLAKDSIPEYHVNYDYAPVEKNLAVLGVSVGGMKFSKGPGLPDCVVKSFEVAHMLS